MTNHIDWNKVRESVELDPSIAYLNTGTSGLVPKSVFSASQSSREALAHNPTDFVWRAHSETLWNSRLRLASHLGTLPDRLVFFQNISHAINTVCLSMDLPAGSEILMTDHEYGSMRWAWERAAQCNGWRLITVPLPIHSNDDLEYIDAIRNKMSARTRLLYFSHVLYTTGHVLPAQEICRMARDRNVATMVDGAHVRCQSAQMVYGTGGGCVPVRASGKRTPCASLAG
jgi:isopenicillin-N epimerase